eukprot:GDKH01020663.1.p6 GENE.GDKH01020663.1~~GDKH01020663.1.p6  ORF type:complete len:50 (-),score=5.25 GDKH01020663.1:224-373(-)
MPSLARQPGHQRPGESGGSSLGDRGTVEPVQVQRQESGERKQGERKIQS